MKLSTKVYLLSKSDREYVDDTFDELHSQSRMEWTKEPTPISSPVFVVWRNILENGLIKQKRRAVVDI